MPVPALARLSLGLALSGFALAAGSGLLMFGTQASELLGNRAFLVKMLLLVLAGLNAAWFHTRRSLERLDAVAKVSMGVSTLIWLLVVACGRWIAYW